MGDGAKSSGEWTNERISMSHLGSFSRSSNYVRSLVRQQFQNQSDQPNTAWERLRERLGKNSSFEYEEETPSFVKKKASDVPSEENSDDSEEEGDDEETANFSNKTSSKESAKTPPSEGHTSASSSRRSSAPQTPGESRDTGRRYTLPSRDAHSKILNRRLSLAESVIKNYSKYIRTPDESQAERTTLAKTEKDIPVKESKQEQVNKQPIEAISEEEHTTRLNIQPIVAISESECSPVGNTEIVNRDTPSMIPASNFLNIPAVCPLGSSYTVPPSPATKPNGAFFDASVRWKSFSGEELSLARSVTDVTSVSTKDKVVADKVKLPRLSAAQTSKAEKKKLSPKSREEAIQRLRGDYETLAENKRLRRVGRKKGTVYEQLQRDRERRVREAQTFYHEMDQITKSLKAINNRLDERIKILNCNEPHRVRYQGILQIAFAGLPFKKL